MNKISLKILVLLIAFMLSACSEKTNKEEEIVPDEPISLDESLEKDNDIELEIDSKENEELAEEIEVTPLPQTLSELAELPAGYTSPLTISDPDDQVEIDELTKNLPDISGSPTENQLDAYYSQLLAVFQHGFQGPEELIAKMKFQAIGSPDIDNPRMQFKENLNVLVILDASGSMGKDIGGQTQMAAAQKAILHFVDGFAERSERRSTNLWT